MCGFPEKCLAQTVTAEQLTHRVPSGAAREYRASLQALIKGDLAQSIAHCRKAIESDPGNASAHNDLGILYLQSNKTEEALREFERAVSIQPGWGMAHVNASYAALALGRAREAESAAQRALEISRNNHRAHLLLGWSLVAQYRYSIGLRFRNEHVTIGSLQQSARLLHFALGIHAYLKAWRHSQTGAFRSWDDLRLVSGTSQHFRSRQVRELYVVMTKRAGY